MAKLITEANLADLSKIMELEDLGFQEGIREKKQVLEERISCFRKAFWLLKMIMKSSGIFHQKFGAIPSQLTRKCLL